MGPCDIANVALVIRSEDNRWFGGLAGDAVYDALINWLGSATARDALSRCWTGSTASGSSGSGQLKRAKASDRSRVSRGPLLHGKHL